MFSYVGRMRVANMNLASAGDRQQNITNNSYHFWLLRSVASDTIGCIQ